jgi:methylase of polypeptide subunit release factors
MNELGQTATGDISPSVAMLQMVRGFWVSRAIYVAANLGLADLLKDEPKRSEDLAQATATHAPSLYRLMRALASVGIFAQDEQGRFALTPVGATLRTDVPGSLRAWVLLHLGEEYYRAGGDVMHTLRTGGIAFDHLFGMGVWEYRAQHPEAAKIFDEAMANLVGMYNAAVLASYPFSTIDRVVDVGGGDGSLMVALLQANPRMKGMLFDLPHVAEKATRRIGNAGLAGRCEILAGDAFASVPGGGDAYILSRMINGFDDARAVALLKNCHQAMTEKGKLLVVQRVLPDRVQHSIAVQALVLSDFNMMVMIGGRERTEGECRALLEEAGFRVTKVIPTQSEMTIIECARP